MDSESEKDRAWTHSVVLTVYASCTRSNADFALGCHLATQPIDALAVAAAVLDRNVAQEQAHALSFVVVWSTLCAMDSRNAALACDLAHFEWMRNNAELHGEGEHKAAAAAASDSRSSGAGAGGVDTAMLSLLASVACDFGAKQQVRGEEHGAGEAVQPQRPGHGRALQA